MKSLLKITCLLALFAASAVTMQAQKFGYVNSAAILADMPDVKQADANLEALQKQLQKKGQALLEQLQVDYTALQKRVQGGEMSPKEQEIEAQKLQAREQEIGQFEQDMRKQVSDKREELLGPIYEKVNQAIEDVAKENEFQFIFDQNVLLFAEESQNVNDLVKAKLAN
jgi:outer membrane protein